MHENEYRIDESLVAELIRDQFPQWSDLGLERIDSSGTVNVIYRLGDDMSVRLPRIADFSGHVDRETRWIPRFATGLPIATPELIAVGRPTKTYPSAWSVMNWIEGENATFDRLTDPLEAAAGLARFVVAMRQLALDDGWVPESRTHFRGKPLAARDAQTRASIAKVETMVDARAAAAVWASALNESPWDGPPVWVHQDLHPGNLLAYDGRLCAVLDFGIVDIGDPANDTIAAWWLFTGESREAFRCELGVDDATWTRGRGFALSIGLDALPYYIDTNPVFAAMAKRAIDEAIADRP